MAIIEEAQPPVTVNEVKAGWYLWRKWPNDDWEFIQVGPDGLDGELVAYRIAYQDSYGLEELGGEWKPTQMPEW